MMINKNAKCETERDVAKSYSILILLLGIPLCLFYTMAILSVERTYSDPKYNILVPLLYISVLVVPFIVVETIFFLIWFPNYIKRKKALKYGEKYDAKIIKINHRTKGKYKIIQRRNYFTLTIQYNKHRKKKIFNTDVYVDFYDNYIPYNRKCTIYEYKGKAYPQDFLYISNNSKNVATYNLVGNETKIDLGNNSSYYLGKNYTPLDELFEFSNEEIPSLSEEEFKLAMLEREVIPPKSSNAHILTPAIMISDNGHSAYVFVEIKIHSFRAYDFEELGFYKELCKYARASASIYFEGNVERYISVIKEYVEKKCRELVNDENKFKLSDILIAIRNI